MYVYVALESQRKVTSESGCPFVKGVKDISSLRDFGSLFGEWRGVKLCDHQNQLRPTPGPFIIKVALDSISLV